MATVAEQDHEREEPGLTDEVTLAQRARLDEAYAHLEMHTWKVIAGPAF